MGQYLTSGFVLSELYIINTVDLISSGYNVRFDTTLQMPSVGLQSIKQIQIHAWAAIHMLFIQHHNLGSLFYCYEVNCISSRYDSSSGIFFQSYTKIQIAVYHWVLGFSIFLYRLVQILQTMLMKCKLNKIHTKIEKCTEYISCISITKIKLIKIQRKHKNLVNASKY